MFIDQIGQIKLGTKNISALFSLGYFKYSACMYSNTFTKYSTAIDSIIFILGSTTTNDVIELFKLKSNLFAVTDLGPSMKQGNVH